MNTFVIQKPIVPLSKHPMLTVYDLVDIEIGQYRWGFFSKFTLCHN